MANRRRPNDGLGVGRRATKETGASAGVCVWYTQIPLLCFTHRCSHYTNTLGVTFYGRVGDPALARASVRQSGCWILHTLYVWCFTTGVINLVSESSQTRARSFRFFPFSHIQYRPFPSVPRALSVAQVLRSSRIMEATQGYPNLLSEKQAAKRLGVARITLLRAREAGRIRFFRIGTRVLYCAEQLTEFLASCERNGNNRKNEQVTVSRSDAKRQRALWDS